MALENIPADEEENIRKIADLTITQLKRRYDGPPEKPILRGVHAKGHGCVAATFKVNENLPENRRVGIFATPGRSYQATIRFSNASVLVTDDSPLNQKMLRTHGSRGMAVKLFDVAGDALIPAYGPLTQDFLMINQPVFAFGNVADYLALSEALRTTDDAGSFVGGLILKAQGKVPGTSPEDAKRAGRTLNVFQRVQSLKVSPAVVGSGPFEDPPVSPLDNRYFGAAPFLFGPDRVMKISARPVPPEPDINTADYLRNSLKRRLTSPRAEAAVFKFLLQVRTADDVAAHVDTAIEDATLDWPEAEFPFEEVATITIEPQDFDTPERNAECERLTYSPWHGLAAHRPLGGINRLRKPVYETSSHHRLAGRGNGGCPMTGGA